MTVGTYMPAYYSLESKVLVEMERRTPGFGLNSNDVR
jgi:hypothetical protein